MLRKITFLLLYNVDLIFGTIVVSGLRSEPRIQDLSKGILRYHFISSVYFSARNKLEAAQNCYFTVRPLFS